ncbi:MAG: methyltransferase domain-containing protein [Candidatus Binatia bacterium]
MSYKLHLPVVQDRDWSRGEYWRDEDFREHLALCDCQTIATVFARMLPKGGRVLEAGCGTGRWVVWLQRHGYRVSGMDLSEEALRRLRQQVPGAPVAQSDLFAIPAADAVFDAVLSLGVVEHWEDGPQHALRELRRVLKPGGLLFLSVPFNNLFRRLLFNHALRIIERLFRRRGRAVQFAEYRFDRREVAAFLRQAGFRPLECFIDDYSPPKSIGLAIDLAPIFGVRGRTWELNRTGRAVRLVCDAISPWLTAGCILCVARAA